MSALTKEKKAKLFEQFGGAASNTGSTDAQIALFTERINMLSSHLRENKKDHQCRRTLLTLVGKRKRLLNYLQHKDISEYRSLIEKLGIRK
ncbi:MAG TPA: 30S ribosomal protein S15 [Saprospiraceae bacterium]|nr:30S ribosomal protein S15 [Saprospiraceae bacterium]MCB9272173.1 30S ribosomal protein S15 [Lewinellaceae bacterium]HPG08653.1 30S ribosomal protein S15 [Saprospiraceae bacterium]HQU54359.1 30S ribosomal protein S15 [Saprospiraceae bacterium]HRV84398.1 30S ribosomal protein S15 [Saprospiraceae bacterium]